MAARNRCEHLMRHEDTQLCFEYPRRDTFPGILKESVGQLRVPLSGLVSMTLARGWLRIPPARREDREPDREGMFSKPCPAGITADVTVGTTQRGVGRLAYDTGTPPASGDENRWFRSPWDAHILHPRCG